MRKPIHVYLAFLLVLIFSDLCYAQNEKKAFYAVLVDNTGSLRTQVDDLKSLGKGVIDHLPNDGPISLFDFATKGDVSRGIAVVTSGVEWTEDKTVLNAYIDGLTIRPGRTALYDGIYSIVENLNNKAKLAKGSAKIIIVITDGEDRVSEIKEKQLIEKLRDGGVKFYAIGLVGQLDDEGGLINKSPKTRAVEFLEKAAKDTGGRAVFPKSSKTELRVLLNDLFAGSR